MDHDHSDDAEGDTKGGLEPNLWVHQVLASAFLFAVSFAGGILGLILVRCRRQRQRGNGVAMNSRLQKQSKENIMWNSPNLSETVGFQCLGHSNWTSCSPLSPFCPEQFQTFSLSYWGPILITPEG